MRRINVVVGMDAAGMESGYWANVRSGDPDSLQRAYPLMEPFPRCAIRLGSLPGLQEAVEYAKRKLAGAGIPEEFISVSAFV